MEYILKGLVIAAFMFFSFRANQKEARKKAEAPHVIPEKQGNGTPGGAPVKFHKKYRNTILLSCFLLVHLFVTLAGINRTTSYDTPAKATILSIRTTKKVQDADPAAMSILFIMRKSLILPLEINRLNEPYLHQTVTTGKWEAR